MDLFLDDNGMEFDEEVIRKNEEDILQKIDQRKDKDSFSFLSPSEKGKLI